MRPENRTMFSRPSSMGNRSMHSEMSFGPNMVVSMPLWMTLDPSPMPKERTHSSRMNSETKMNEDDLLM